MKEINNWKELSKSRVLILFLECNLGILIKRFSLTRRPHPVPGENNLELSIKRELKLITNPSRYTSKASEAFKKDILPQFSSF